MRRVVVHVMEEERPWAHKRHITPDDVPQRWQFIQAGGAQPGTKWCEAAGIVVTAEGLFWSQHRSKLQQFERLRLQTGPDLAEQNGATQLVAHQCGDDGLQGEGGNEGGAAENDVGAALERAVEGMGPDGSG